jgi:G3E family GTPase
MAIPVYIVTGFLDAGKTTFLNGLLNRRDWRDVRILLVQFETGEEEFESRHHNCLSLSFPKKALEQHPKQIVEQIHSFIQSNELDEIWIEWNGIVPFSELQALLLAPALCSLCKIQKVLHIADAANIESLLGRTGGALPEQIANSDFAVVRNIRSSDTYYRVRRLLRGINPGVPVYEIKAYNDLYKQLFGKKGHPVNFFFLTVILIVALHFIAKPVFDAFQIR